MATGAIPVKTAQGQVELGTRQLGVSQRHRTVLFLVDGRRSADDVLQMALQAGVPPSCFDELVEMGLIMLPEPSAAPAHGAAPRWPDAPNVDLPLSGFDRPSAAAADSVLPPSRTLSPSISTDSMLGDPRDLESWLPSGADSDDLLEPTVAEARELLLRAVRAEAPLAGSLTLLRLRRARTRAELTKLLGEVEARITKPHRALAASVTMRRARQLLGSRADAPLASV